MSGAVLRSPAEQWAESITASSAADSPPSVPSQPGNHTREAIPRTYVLLPLQAVFVHGGLVGLGDWNLEPCILLFPSMTQRPQKTHSEPAQARKKFTDLYN